MRGTSSGHSGEDLESWGHLVPPSVVFQLLRAPGVPTELPTLGSGPVSAQNIVCHVQAVFPTLCEKEAAVLLEAEQAWEEFPL